MPYRVLIVDDSAFYRRRLSSFLEQDPSIDVIGYAVNGEDALNKALALKPDVITMDVEMPVLDGISAVAQIMQKIPTPILMFSSLTTAGAKETLDALEAGAIDFLPKKFDDISRERPQAIRLLQQRVKAIARTPIKSIRPSRPIGLSLRERASQRSVSTGQNLKPSPYSSANQASNKTYKLLVLGASTGGPVALQKVISGLPENFPHPILIIQHMPNTFTKAFAERLDKHAKINVKLAQDNERINKGTAYLAVGGKQLKVTGRGMFAKINICDAPREQKIHFHPSIDFTLDSVKDAFGGDVLSVVLTGMGTDGALGCKLLKSKGGTIWAQDEDSSVIYGMPKAVAESGDCDRVIPIDKIAEHIITEMMKA
ncbi:chemotaxis response regulator protein-glutamate methylesterase [Alteromonas sp. W364]|uniref:protein-glutamate methylesterase/protein-glutamine glutaminase n=1 Tax=Alteromonas sp. W364 TaxID=3075610 RepID=UPI002887B2AF|nr:chemotaxis response regulator protein-glutamate methylesterase [Alteromonas sp. W364]MDT0628276.1 chemotaxis response regulator protein-glutamate methylesterase [Alteromonas sp. W364]